jgi:hypothetical protein
VIIVVWRGYRTTPIGHIANDRALYPFIPALSSLKPILAVFCSVLFAAADLVRKLVVNNL